MTQQPKQIVISKENAVFWMDKNGFFNNKHGKFEHPKIIKFFNASIKKDEKGYYVHQVSVQCEEKVYFRYEDTALFVVDVKLSPKILLVLNTTETIAFDPGSLTTKDDNLYISTDEHRIKFTPDALLKISRFIEGEEGEMFVRVNDKTYPIG